MTSHLNSVTPYLSHVIETVQIRDHNICFKDRFLLFQVNRNFATLFFKLLVSIFNKEISNTELKELNLPFCEGFPNFAVHTS